MKKNVASQVIGAQMTTAADGTPFTGSVTVAVTGDAGTQATGSVGSGACTHEGGGYHTYAPAQAETNYDLVAFTFSGTGAITVTVQVYTEFPQTGDAYAYAVSNLGAAGAAATEAGGTGDHLTAINLPNQTMDITGNITGNLSGSVGSVTGAVGSVTGNVGGNVSGSVGSVTGAVGSVTGTVGGIAGTITTLDALDTAQDTQHTTTQSALTTVDGKVDTLVTRITSTLFAGITSLAEWLGMLAGKQTGDATALTEIRATGAGSGTFNPTADSGEALRDRGDAAWATATGFSTHSAADVATTLGTGSAFTAIPWNAAWDAEVQSEVQDAIEANHLDHLLAATYDPASKPGASDALLNEMVENDAGVSRFTANALEQGPSGAGSTLVEFRGVVTRVSATYHVSFIAIVAGAVVTTGLSSLVCTFYDEDGTDLTFSGTPSETGGFVYATGTLGTALSDNRPLVVKVGATYDGTAYSSVLPGVSVA